jgi:hypothetical protein
MLGVHDAAPPTDEEWNRWLAFAREAANVNLRLLVETTGQGGPNAKQRKQLAEVLSGRDVRCAILSDSMFVRGVVTAVAWLGVELRAFPPGDLSSACGYLGLSARECEVTLQTLPILEAQCHMSPWRAAR